MKDAHLLAALGFLLPLLISGLLTRLLIRWAPRLGLIDQPGVRKVHTRPTPRAGGLAIYMALLAAAISLSLSGLPFSLRGMLALLGLGGILVLLGLVDDLRPLPWQLRLAVQTAVAGWAVWSWPCGAEWGPRLLALVWIVGLVNAFNMLDNMDLLAGGTAWIASGMFALALVLGQESAGEARSAVPFLMLMGALTGFLWFNRPPARIFLGDAGSTFLGFFLGVLGLAGGVVDEAAGPTWMVPVCVLAVPWYDLVSVVGLRLSQGRSPFHADKQHLSHRLTARGLPPSWAVRVIHLLALASGLMGLLFYGVRDPVETAVLAALFACGWLLLAAVEYLVSRQGTYCS